MPARDVFHQNVIEALTKDGWIITHDPYPLKIGKRDLFVDLGAEKIFAAEKAGQKIAVEIKSFSGRSLIADAENALGQFLMYRQVLRRTEPERILFLAVDDETFANAFTDELGQLFLVDFNVKLLVFNIERKEIAEWLN